MPYKSIKFLLLTIKFLLLMVANYGFIYLFFNILSVFIFALHKHIIGYAIIACLYTRAKNGRF